MHNKVEYPRFRSSHYRFHIKLIQLEGFSAFYQGRLNLRHCCLVYLQSFSGNYSRHIAVQQINSLEANNVSIWLPA
jgi:hypothetical protein